MCSPCGPVCSVQSCRPSQVLAFRFHDHWSPLDFQAHRTVRVRYLGVDAVSPGLGLVDQIPDIHGPELGTGQFGGQQLGDHAGDRSASVAAMSRRSALGCGGREGRDDCIA
jgi:hypothetical protein